MLSNNVNVSVFYRPLLENSWRGNTLIFFLQHFPDAFLNRFVFVTQSPVCVCVCLRYKLPVSFYTRKSFVCTEVDKKITKHCVWQIHPSTERGWPYRPTYHANLFFFLSLLHAYTDIISPGDRPILKFINEFLLRVCTLFVKIIWLQS